MPRSLLISLLSALALLSVVFFRNAGTWLVVSDSLPQRLDVIFTLGGDRERDRYSLELAKKYPEATWVISGRDSKRYLHWIATAGVDTGRTRFVDTCSSTFAEVLFLRRWLRQQTGDSAATKTPVNVGLVTSPYHMRRVALVTGGLFNENGILLHRIAVPFEKASTSRDQYDHWWRYKRMHSVVKLEWIKMAHDMFRVAFA